VPLFERVLPPGVDPAFDKLWQQFTEPGPVGEEFRKKRFKFLAKILSAPVVVSRMLSMLGVERPVIFGNGYLAVKFFLGPNYVEVNIDVNSSVTAQKIAGTVLDKSDAVSPRWPSSLKAGMLRSFPSGLWGVSGGCGPRRQTE